MEWVLAAGTKQAHGFEDLKLGIIWCGCFDGNEKSKRVFHRVKAIVQLPARRSSAISYYTSESAQAACKRFAKPKCSYVDRPVSSSFACTMFVIAGLATIAMGVLVFFLIPL